MLFLWDGRQETPCATAVSPGTGAATPMNPAESKVLLVDDDPAILRLFSKWLNNGGYSARSAEDGRQALSAIEVETPDFLITDWDMPNVDGLELCRRVRRLDLPHYVYILFLTSKSAPEEMIEGLDIGADDFLCKPIAKEELLARMRAGGRVIELERRLSRLAGTDPLTGVLTRRSFFEASEKEWHRSKRLHLPLSCVMVDIDFFKRINDIHGHPAGDTVIKSVAGLLAAGCRRSDSICRYGGEEFCVMLPETGEGNSAIWAERVCKRIATNVMSVDGKEIRVTASFGVAQRHDDTQTIGALVDQADQALLCAKQTGRNRVVRYELLNSPENLELEKSNQQAGLFRGILARHVMTPIVACLEEKDTVGQAAEFFLRSRINSTPVINADGELAGILSEKDLMVALVSLEYWQRPVRDFMKPNVISYEEDTPVGTIYEFLCRVSIRRVAIVREGRPTGAISRGTLLRWFKNLVASRGLSEDREGSVPASHRADPHRSRERLKETARELAHQASRLQRHFQEDVEDLMPYVVGGATGMQELVNDLLAYSRFANPADESGQSALLGSVFAD